VNRSGKFVVLVMLLVWSLMPVMVCALPDAQMTPAEHECCAQMPQQCGGMNMPASHNCCHKQMRSEQAAPLSEKPQVIQHLAAVQILPICHVAIALPILSGAQIEITSRPLSPPASITILRI
jgi:hypothetical protein